MLQTTAVLVRPESLYTSSMIKVKVICNNFFFHFLVNFDIAKKSPADPSHDGSIVYTVEQENSEEPEKDLCLLPVQQNLLVFLFLQHSDPFTSHLSDIMGERPMQHFYSQHLLSSITLFLN